MDTNSPPPTSPQPAATALTDSAVVPQTAQVLTRHAPESRLRRIGMAFVHWLIYLVLFGLLIELLRLLMHFVHPKSGGSVGWTMVALTGAMLAATLPGFVTARIEGRPFGDFGLPARSAFGRNFWVGALWGIVGLSALLIPMRVAGVFHFGSLAVHGTRLLEFAAFYAVFFLFTGFFEEFLVRGYSQWVLSKGLNFWPTAVLLSAGFGALHGGNPGESKAGLVAAGLIGLFFCLTLRRTGNLWWAVGFHMSWDWGESYLYSVPDSGTVLPGHLLNSSFNGPAWLTGGTVGPEGSLLVFVVIAAMWVLFDRMYPEVKWKS